MSTTAQRISSSVTVFNNTSPTFNQLVNVFFALKKRPLVGSDFETAKSARAAMIEAAREKLFNASSDSAEAFVEQHPRDRNINSFCSYMAAYSEEDTNRWNLITAVDRMKISWRECLRCIRVVPFAVEPNRTEALHIKNTSRTLSYSSDDVVNAALLALPIGKALAPYLSNEKSSIPIVIPHSSHGCFVGVALKTLTAVDPDFTITWTASRTATRGIAKIVEGSDGCLKLGSAIQITKSVGFRGFDEGYNYAYELLRPFQTDAEDIRKLRIGLDIYSWGPLHKQMVSEKDHQEWGDVCSRVKEAVVSLVGRNDRSFHGIYTLPQANL